MAIGTQITAQLIRERLAFDVERLSAAGHRLEAVDRDLLRLKRGLERRVEVLTGEATRRSVPELNGTGGVQIRYAQALAIAQLARRAALGEILQHSGRLSLIAAMAVSRWIGALVDLRAQRAPRAIIKAHIDAGRIAHRTLATLKPQADLRSGCGQITSAAVVAEFVHDDDRLLIDEQLEEGLFRGRSARGIDSDDDVIAAASRALRTGAGLLESMAERAEPTAQELTRQAEGVEARVEADLLRQMDGLA